MRPYALGELSVPSGVASMLSVTLCSQLATLPITIPAFGTFSLIAPLANAVPVDGERTAFAVSIVLVPFSLTAVADFGARCAHDCRRCALFFKQLFAAVPVHL